MEFKSELENVMPAEELNLPPSPGFGPYRRVMPSEAVQHPAKFNVFLVEFLILRYTKPGDVVLDCMAGSGVLGVIAALHGRNAVQVELEKRFHEWMEKARENVERYPSLTCKGWVVNILGDARRLSELLSKTDIVITSPPYAETYSASKSGKAIRTGETRIHEEKHLARPYTEDLNKDNIGNLPLGNVDTVITSPPYGESYLGGGDPERRKERLIKAGYDPKDFLGGRARNAVLKQYSEVDAVITSPPFGESNQYRGGTQNKERMMKGGRPAPYSTNRDNIGNLPLGKVDAVITSPPFADSLTSEHDEEKETREVLRKSGGNRGKPIALGRSQVHTVYSQNKDNIGNLPLGEVDAVITSPPYEGSLEGTTRHTRGGIASRDPALAQTGTYATRLSFGVPIGYSPNKDNIGNLKSSDEEYEELAKGLMKDGKPTYLSEMLKVYREMFKVLKPNGLAIVVIKPFQRNFKIVDLPYHTYLLMSRVGFRLEKLYKLRLKQQSFWRILMYKKHPELPRIAHEYVIVARKVP